MTTGPVGIRQLLFLLGFMGSGKTTVGRLLAARLGWRFVDLDAEIEQRAGRSIIQLFAEEGEPYFRQLERALLEETLAEVAGVPTVVALGGGTVTQPQNLARIHAEGGVTVWLRCPVEILRRRCSTMTNRPLFRDAASFQQLYQQRLPYYAQADFTVDVGELSPQAVVEKILALAVF